MNPQIFVPSLTAAQRQRLQQGLRSPDAFTVRCCQALLASARGDSPAVIARQLGCTARTVRNAIHAFAREGLDCLREKSSRPHSARPFLNETYTEPLKDLLHHSPRTLGQPTSLWTLGLVAEVCHRRGWTPRPLTGEAIRVALKRLGIRWLRAKHWITLHDFTGADPAAGTGAEAVLLDLADVARPFVSEALARQRQAVLRLERLLQRLETTAPPREARRALRAVEFLSGLQTAEARAVLEALAQGAPDAALTRRARAALTGSDKNP
jgi:hypothetical protein